MTDNFLAWERQAVCSVKSVLGNRIIVVKSEEIKYKIQCMATDTDGYPVFLFIFGWIAEGREAYSHNYRDCVSQYPFSPLDWQPNFPHKTCAWSYGLTRAKVHIYSLAK